MNALIHFALVTAVIALVPLVAGWQVARQLMFPLGFLYLAVPFGEFLVPTMIDWTADFTVHALQLTGIPVFREGQNFVIPSPIRLLRMFCALRNLLSWRMNSPHLRMRRSLMCVRRLGHQTSRRSRKSLMTTTP